MKLLTKEITAKLKANGEATKAAQDAGQSEPDHRPVVKIFAPWGAATWLITEIVPDRDDDLAFGLCDLGMGEPELGYVSLSELSQTFNIRVQVNGVEKRVPMTLERDLHFTADKPISAYADEARSKGAIQA